MTAAHTVGAGDAARTESSTTAGCTTGQGSSTPAGMVTFAVHVDDGEVAEAAWIAGAVEDEPPPIPN